ncbi:hypothetical protein ACF0H5_016146 [Mactra antiquata]
MAGTFRTRWNIQVLLIIFVAVVVSYTLVRTGIIELPAPKNVEGCPASALLSKNSKDNQKKIINYPLVDSVRYLSTVGLQDVDSAEEYDGNPVIVTASASNYFSLIYSLIKRLKTTLVPKLKIYVYDLGLTTKQREMLCAEGECLIRQFPFEEFPNFLKENIPSFAWKPVIIQLMLREFGFVVWMDSAVYIPDGNIQGGIEIARKTGIAVSHKMISNTDNNLAYETDPNTFRALGEEPCAFEKQYKFNAGLIFIRRNSFTYKYIMRPWVSCALTKSCISADFRYYSRCQFADRNGYCHRFDQSVLSIILNRLFYNDLESINIDDKIKWTKCFVKDEMMVFNDMVLTDTDNNSIQCPTIEFIPIEE